MRLQNYQQEDHLYSNFNYNPAFSEAKEDMVKSGFDYRAKNTPYNLKDCLKCGQPSASHDYCYNCQPLGEPAPSDWKELDEDVKRDQRAEL